MNALHSTLEHLTVLSDHFLMRPDDIKARILKRRTLLIIGALVSLCLSDGVGPRLMPLPVCDATTASVIGQQVIDPEIWRASLPTKGPSPRVEMAATARNRAAARHLQVQTAIYASKGLFEAPAVIILKVRGAYGPLTSLTGEVRRPPSRGPPRLV